MGPETIRPQGDRATGSPRSAGQRGSPTAEFGLAEPPPLNLKRPNLFRFIGFGNYVEIFGSDEFRRSVTLAFTALGVIPAPPPDHAPLNEPFPPGFVRTIPLPGRSAGRQRLAQDHDGIVVAHASWCTPHPAYRG